MVFGLLVTRVIEDEGAKRKAVSSPASPAALVVAMDGPALAPSLSRGVMVKVNSPASISRPVRILTPETTTFTGSGTSPLGMVMT